MSARTVEVDGQPWQDGWVGADADGTLWRLLFVQSTWGPVYDRWVWQAFGVELDHALDSEVVKHPLTKVWPQATPAAEKTARQRRVPDIEPDPRSGKRA